MDTFKQLLIVYSTKLKSNQLFIDDIVKILEENSGLKVAKEDLKLKDGQLVLKLKPKQKLTLILYKDLLLEKFNKAGIKITDLR